MEVFSTPAYNGILRSYDLGAYYLPLLSPSLWIAKTEQQIQRLEVARSQRHWQGLHAGRPQKKYDQTKAVFPLSRRKSTSNLLDRLPFVTRS